MKNYILIPFFTMMALGATSASAHDKNEEKKSCCSKEFNPDDFHCYRAWKKEFKREKKMYKADLIECYRPWAAERKRRKACKKEWKRDMIEHDHQYGYDHYYWF
jgi:hypothetical protein